DAIDRGEQVADLRLGARALEVQGHIARSVGRAGLGRGRVRNVERDGLAVDRQRLTVGDRGAARADRIQEVGTASGEVTGAGAEGDDTTGIGVVDDGAEAAEVRTVNRDAVARDRSGSDVGAGRTADPGLQALVAAELGAVNELLHR